MTKRYFVPMTPDERAAHEKFCEARKSAPMSTADKRLIVCTFVALAALAYAANAGWFL